MNPATLAPHSSAPVPVSSDWRFQLDAPQRRALRRWLYAVAGMTFVVMVVGGITRLTQSGLSIVDWQPLMGVIPPLNEAQWQQAFDQYRQFPEYQLLRRGMTLDEFRFIYFWEYLHRLTARLIGVVFLVPFVWFWARGYFGRVLLGRSLILFGLGGMQGVLGWVMVQSGLAEQPSVSHYRLAAHLGLAFIIFGYAVWLARDLALADRTRAPRDAGAARAAGATASPATLRRVRRGLMHIGGLLAVQIIYGAFVAGLKAGFMYNTFPLMGGRLVPEYLLTLEPAWRNFVLNPVAVQWVHRVLGTLLLLAVAAFYLRVRRAEVDDTTRHLNAVFAALIAAQYLLGIATLVMGVPVALGVIHQGAAMLIFGVWVWWLHHMRQGVAVTQPI